MRYEIVDEKVDDDDDDSDGVDNEYRDSIPVVDNYYELGGNDEMEEDEDDGEDEEMEICSKIKPEEDNLQKFKTFMNEKALEQTKKGKKSTNPPDGT